jgi:hypothetical protein
MIGVFDVLNNDSDPVKTIGMGRRMTTPGRMFFTRLQLKF